MKMFTVCRTVVLTVDVEAETEAEALEFTQGMGGAAFDTEELVEETVVAVSDLEAA